MKNKIAVTIKAAIWSAIIYGIFMLVAKIIPEKETTKTAGNYIAGDYVAGDKTNYPTQMPIDFPDSCEKIKFQLKYYEPGLFEESDLNSQLANYDNCITSDKSFYDKNDFERC